MTGSWKILRSLNYCCRVKFHNFRVLLIPKYKRLLCCNFNIRVYSTTRKMIDQHVKISWDLKLSSDEVSRKTEEIIGQCRQVYNSVAEVKDEDVSFENVLKVLSDYECEWTTKRTELKFPQHVSPDKALRAASTEAEKKLSEFFVEISMRQDIFQKLLALDGKKPKLEYEAQRYLDRLIKLGKRNGLHLSDEVQKEMKTLKSQMVNLEIEFSKNLNEDVTCLEFSDEELDGLPTDFISSIDTNPDTGKRKVTLKYPHYIPIMRHCCKADTRRSLEFAFNTRCMKENTQILEELVTLRQKEADLLGFPTHAAYMVDDCMSKTVENVMEFLISLATKLKPLWSDELKVLLSLKEKECKEAKIPFDEKINMWDLSYYTNKLKELEYAVDQNKLKEYFPLPVVTQGLLEIYQKLLGLVFKEVENPKVWHPEVKMFSVEDAQSKKLMGYFMLDLFPREGKYGHAAMFKLQPSCLLPNGSRQVGAVAMVANFTKATAEKPSLLAHNEVVTFFHEFGHVMHALCSQADYTHFSLTKVERDFVETPSIMLENWCWEVEPLRMMSSHYLTQAALPDDMLAALIKSRLANTGCNNMRQIVLALFDQKIHTQKEADTRAIYSQLNSELMGILPTEGTNFAANFGHLAGGYDAQYYSYLWCEVFAMDMFYSQFKEGNIMNPEVGKLYRYKILQPGGTKDAADLLHDFLGRKPNQDAFLKSKGLKV